MALQVPKMTIAPAPVVARGIHPGGQTGMRKFLTPEQFKAAIKAGEKLDDVAIRQAFNAEVEVDTEGKSGTASRSLTFTISTASVDRQTDTVSIDGWDLTNFEKNPVMMWAHNYSQPPIARATKTWKHSGKLKASVEFVDAENPAIGKFAEGILQLYKGGFLNAVSVGFMPLKWEWSKDESRPYGIDFSQQELLEFSAVPVPANPEALIEGRGLEGPMEQLREWARGILKVTPEDLTFLDTRAFNAKDIQSIADAIFARAAQVAVSIVTPVTHEPAINIPLAIRNYEIEIERMRL